MPLVFLIFYEVSGSPLGVEGSVKAASPLLALLGFLLLPFVWSVPEALITAELGTMFPKNAGYVVWVSSALGPFWGFQLGWMKWLSGVIDNALYPVLSLDYLKSSVPQLEGGFPRVIAILALTTALTYMNYSGLTVVGWVAILLGVFSILPFVVMGHVTIPKLKPLRWSVVDLHTVDWGLYLNTLFWNLNYWDSISTLAGEVENPGRTLLRALFYALILVVWGYFFPLLSGTGAVPLHRERWSDGYFSDIARMIGGVWLRFWVQAAAAVSNMGMFVAEMSSDSFQLLGMAEKGMLPEFFAKRSKYGTPLTGILFSASGVVLLSWLSFQEIVAAENFLYCFGMIMEFIAFVTLRVKYPKASQPYKRVLNIDTPELQKKLSRACAGQDFAFLGTEIKQHSLTDDHKILNLILCFNIEPGLHRSGITVSKAFHQMCIAEKQPIDLPRAVMHCIYPFSSKPARVHAMHSAALPFGRLLTVLLNKQNVPDHEGDM
ncbi:hypothetical protein RHMOL_Rhmol05G0060600 [Rhododendron molle]|uniref:Uncharacterized protein n=1 Tax=Rhododendron molle TaxID=49168 RepID=A0ACC0NL45_RHOML|nr:hypothetical protein RHMOL_Rhmol05G0060600 [Rhododendron molle]